MRIPDQRWNKLDWNRPDAVIAAELGVSRQAVWEARRKRRISTVSAWVFKQQKPETAPPAPKRAAKATEKVKSSKARGR
jgi:hypothetical protein